MINTRNTTLNQRPKALNAVGVNIPIYIDLGAMVNTLVPVTKSSHVVVAREFVSKQRGITGNFISHERNKRVSFNVGHNFGHNFTTSLNSTNNFGFTLCPSTTLTLWFEAIYAVAGALFTFEEGLSRMSKSWGDYS